MAGFVCFFRFRFFSSGSRDLIVNWAMGQVKLAKMGYFVNINPPKRAGTFLKNGRVLFKWAISIGREAGRNTPPLDQSKHEVLDSRAVRTNTNPNGTEANVPDRSLRACVARESKS